MPNTSSQISFFLPPHIQALFGEPPLFRGEDDGVYFTLMEHFAKFIKPADIIQWWWTKDMTDHTWEIRRLRRFKVLLIELHRDREHQSLQTACSTAALVKTEYVESEDGESEAGWVETYRDYDPPPVPDSEKDSVGFFRYQIKDYKAVDSLIASAELRRDRTLREIERRRENLARRLYKASEEAVGGEIVKLPEAA
jgi:hypothetical protein